ncbi:unnamed protein product [Camellia sinensis]
MVLHEGFPVPKSVQDTGFDAPEINSFGHSFRDYDAKSERQQTVEEFYRVNHINQAYDFWLQDPSFNTKTEVFYIVS